MPPAAILDVDGTLVDTNYHHTLAWHRAFKQTEVVLPIWRIHGHIGMGGDQLVKALGGEQLEDEMGDDIRAAESGHAVVLASSAKAQEVEHYLDLLGARGQADGWTTSADVEATKPERAASRRRSCRMPARLSSTPRSRNFASRSTRPRLRQARGHGRQARHVQDETRLREDA